jgi:hypothetical protein
LADPYLIPGTDVLRNKLGIMDPDHLDRQIDDFAIVEASYLFNEGPPVRPSLAGWQAVHKAMFGEVFDWAGDFRTIHIRKLDENSDPSGYFTAPEGSSPTAGKPSGTSSPRCGARRPTTLRGSPTISPTYTPN